MMLLQTLCLIMALVVVGRADTPANCTYDDLLGTWHIYEGYTNNGNKIQCPNETGNSVWTYNLTMTLKFPDVVVDSAGNTGYWTLIYNQGFEIVVNQRKYFAFSKYVQNGKNVTSYCGETLMGKGWSHSTLGNNWGCIYGQKLQQAKAKTYILNSAGPQPQMYRTNYNFIEAINKRQKSWTARPYPEYEKMSLEDLLMRSGGRKSMIVSRPKAAPVKSEHLAASEELPTEFDWRMVEGVNYVSPVRNQGACGSCYAFGSMAMNEARRRIMSNNTEQVIFSPQDIVDCSMYSQGCAGGFPYLIGGKYAEDFGLIAEACNPYVGKNGACVTNQSCQRQYSTQYRYIGGFYGGCNEALMRVALVKNGPIVVGFEVYKDFLNYHGGIYHHTFLTDKFNPFELTNHAVLVVGYGQDQITGEKYWSVKNSWGTLWGEKGYFKIRRGSDECGIESLAVESFPIRTY